MNYKGIIATVARNINLPEEVVDSTYKAYWKYIKNYIQNLPLKEDLSEEEFNNLRTSFNIPSLGKLSCTYTKYKSIKQRYNNIKNLGKSYEEVKED